VLHDAADEREAVAVIGLAGDELLEHTQAGGEVACRAAAAAAAGGSNSGLGAQHTSRQETLHNYSQMEIVLRCITSQS
jgi:hypothetical protein